MQKLRNALKLIKLKFMLTKQEFITPQSHNTLLEIPPNKLNIRERLDSALKLDNYLVDKPLLSSGLHITNYLKNKKGIKYNTTYLSRFTSFYKRQRFFQFYEEENRVGSGLNTFLRGSKAESLVCLSVRLTQNNVFCTLQNLLDKSILKNVSSGIKQLKTSKKSLKYSCKVIVPSFLATIPRYQQNRILIANIIVPKYLRRFVVLSICNYFKGQRFFLFFNGKKCFNGCRPPKQRRKKHQRYRTFK